MLSRSTRLFPVLAILGSLISYYFPQLFIGYKSFIVPLLVLIMLSMGLTLTVEDFRNAFKQKYAVVLGLIIQYTVMPFGAFLISLALGLDKSLMLGMVLVGSVAGGTASNVMNYLAKADVALSITMTALSTIVGVVLTPFLTDLLVGATIHIPVAAMFYSLLKIVLLPVIVGLILNHYFHRAVARASSILPLISMLAIVLAIMIIVALNAHQLKMVGPIIFVAVILHNGLGLTLGYWVSRLCGFNHKVSKTISFEVGLQNSGLAAALSIKFFSPLSAVPAAIFSIWHNISGSMLAGYWSKDRTSRVGASVSNGDR
ncbi:bile acid:sodium symporter family protein [Vibrio sp. S4M6]|uniref:bile acid:sodium symporter family protein n=1 Tax=Vibrio sinus TaxID=2946865 RepID=UPI00202A9245|nr:bile acid:sodium symporter family protein [Vibrio sinus]MCL9783258.1 bile acid:sodium symporter family protein [Vibrio sinus]